MIKSFGDVATADVFHGTNSARARKILGAAPTAKRKLDMVNAATAVGDLAMVPGNRFEKLVGDRAGWYSIRINDQFRVIFKWESNGPEQVTITDYH